MKVEFETWAERLVDFLNQNPDATSAAIGRKTVNGIETDKTAVIVGVKAKGTRMSRLIPRDFCGLPTDVITANPGFKKEASVPFMADSSDGIEDASWTSTIDVFDHLAPGMSIGYIGGRGAGTLGMIVWDGDGRPCILSNDHVIEGDNVMATQPAPGENTHYNDIGAKRNGTKNWIDAATAWIENETRFSNIPLPLLEPINGMAPVAVGQIVHKVGRTTLYTTAQVQSIGVHRIHYGAGIERDMWAAKIVPLDWGKADAEDIEISAAGDSGSVWFDDKSRAVCLHFAGDTMPGAENEYALANPMEIVARSLNFTCTNPHAEHGINKQAILYHLEYQLGRNKRIIAHAQESTDQLKILRNILNSDK